MKIRIEIQTRTEGAFFGDWYEPAQDPDDIIDTIGDQMDHDKSVIVPLGPDHTMVLAVPEVLWVSLQRKEADA